jgi:hypothetical protein
VTEWTENALFYVNQEFGLVKNGKVQRRGRINLIGWQPGLYIFEILRGNMKKKS